MVQLISLRKPAFAACVSSQVTIIVIKCALATEIYDPLNAYTLIVETVGTPADEPDKACLTDCAHVCAQVESPRRWTRGFVYRQHDAAFCSAILALHDTTYTHCSAVPMNVSECACVHVRWAAQ